MAIRQFRTTRFSEIVRKKGQPEALVLWADPEKYPQLKRAIRENRVMTVVQDPAGNKKDFGMVGFLMQKNASYLIFPKTLEEYRDKHVVGLKYDLLAKPKAAGRQRKPNRQHTAADTQTPR